MKYLICLFAIVACTSTTTPSLTPIQEVGCAVESTVIAGIATSIKTTLNCTNAAAISSSMQTALGNVNFCTTAAPAVKTLGVSKGLIGNIACPLAVNAVIGYVTNGIPAAWGCSAGSSASTLTSAITAACETILPL